MSLSRDDLTLEFLTDDPEKRAICEAYWLVDPVTGAFQDLASLGSRLGVRGKGVVAQRVGAWCRARVAGRSCVRCGEPVIFTARTQYAGMMRGGPGQRVECQKCHRITEHEKLEWQINEMVREQAEREAEEQPRRAALAATFPPPTEPARVDDLTLTQAAYLVAAIAALRAPDQAHGDPLEIVERSPRRQFATDPLMARRIIRHLFNRKLLIPNVAESSLDAFEFDGDTPTRAALWDVAWHLPFGPGPHSTPDDLRRELKTRLNGDPWPAHWRGDALALWRRLVVYEVLYFTHGHSRLMSDPSSFNPPPEAVKAVARLTRWFSASQLKGFVMQHAGPAAYRRGEPGGAFAYLLRVLAQDALARTDAPWTVPGLSGPHPINPLWLTVMDALRLGNLGYEAAPSEAILNIHRPGRQTPPPAAPGPRYVVGAHRRRR